MFFKMDIGTRSKESREIIALRSMISDLTVEIKKLKKEVYDINRTPDK